MAAHDMGSEVATQPGFMGSDKRSGSDRRTGSDRRVMAMAFDGPDRRAGEERRCEADRRQRRASRRRRR